MKTPSQLDGSTPRHKMIRWVADITTFASLKIAMRKLSVLFPVPRYRKQLAIRRLAIRRKQLTLHIDAMPSPDPSASSLSASEVKRRLQSEEARAALQSAFAASPQEIGEAAAAFAQGSKRSGRG